MAFELNQSVYIPGHGIGVLKEIKAVNLACETKHLMVFEVTQSGIKIMMPEDSPSAKRLRAPIASTDAAKVVTQLKMAPVVNIENEERWHRRNKKQVEIMEAGSSMELAALVRDLVGIKAQRKLSFTEKKLLESASLIVKAELMFALGEEVMADPQVAQLLAAA
jgi:CarD family transcriptional regulator